MKITLAFEDFHIYQLTNQRMPYKRLVTIDLTPEQLEAVKPLKVGTNGMNDVFEIITDCFIQDN